MIETYLDKKSGIVWSTLCDCEVTLDSLEEHIIQAINLAPKNQSVLKKMMIFNDVVPNLDPNKLNDFWEVTLKHSKDFEKTYSALVASSPKDTALCMIYAKSANESKLFEVQVFSTKEAALQWLNSM